MCHNSWHPWKFLELNESKEFSLFNFTLSSHECLGTSKSHDFLFPVGHKHEVTQRHSYSSKWEGFKETQMK